MCGIFGVLSLDPARPQQDPSVLDRMGSVLHHRGPDDQGFYVSPPCYMGAVRLSILDLSGGHQPMSNEDGSVWIVFNGEIYNYKDLRNDLQRQGHVLTTSSDTETIVHLYEQYGPDCVHHLNGMFAFAIWDSRTRELFLARDRLGVKPLYYYQHDNLFMFASEIKAILEMPQVKRQVDLQALNTYLHHGYVPGPRTMFEGIAKLQPGHRMLIRRGQVLIDQYWDTHHRKDPTKTRKDHIEEFTHLFRDSVRLRLISDVPVGVFLSGGLDSSAVAAVAADFAQRALSTFSVTFAVDDELDESAYAREVARRYGFAHHELRLTLDEFVESLPSFAWFMDEPVADPASIALYHLARLARRHVKVALSGEGSDELFAGYWEHVSMRGYDKVRYYQRLPRLVRKAILERMALRLFDRDKVERFIRKADAPLASFLEHTLDYGWNNGSLEVWSDALLSSPLRGDPFDRLREHLRETDAHAYLDQYLYIYLKTYLPDDLLVKADKMTMANSVELRVPFLDYRLVEFATALPTSLRLKRFGWYTVRTKPLLRDIMRDKLPRAVLNKRKWGFLNPSLPWMKTRRVAELLGDVLLSSQALSRGLFDRRYIEDLIHSSHTHGKPAAKLLWKLLVFELWASSYLDHPTSGNSGPSARADGNHSGRPILPPTHVPSERISSST